MSAAALLHDLARRGIRAEAKAGRLVIDAPTGVLTPELREALKGSKVELLALLSGPSSAAPDRLQSVLAAAGLPLSLLNRDDAQRGVIDAMADGELVGYAYALHSSAEREAGRQPPDWDHPSRCALCGPVWLWEGAGALVLSCPWCHNRRAGASIPRPPVRCGECRHFERDDINPDAGYGDCLAGLRPHQPYPHVTRPCGAWRPIE